MSREPVIVTKYKLFDTDGIVLIDDWYDPVCKQCIYGYFGMGDMLCRIENICTEEYLRTEQTELGELLLIHFEQKRLSYGGQCLPVGDLFPIQR